MMICTSIRPLLYKNRYTTLLVDAYGVIYGGHGVFPGVAHTLSAASEWADIWVVTNNADIAEEAISNRLSTMGVMIAADRIISSGRGLACDKIIGNLLRKKRVFVVGPASSAIYVSRAQGKLVSTFERADVVVMTSSSVNRFHHLFSVLCDQLHHYPKPVICCNPDRWLPVGHPPDPIIGWYVAQLEQYGVPVYWIGKPFANFYRVVVQALQQQTNQPIDHRICFFDDNPENVIQFCQHYPLDGCIVKDTGLARSVLTDAMIAKLPNHIRVVPSLGSSVPS